MLKGVFGKVFGTRHERERRRIQPIVDEINEHYARLQGVSEEELRAQTAKFRAYIHERTHELESEVARLKQAKRVTSDPVEREQLDNELSGADGRGGVEAKLRETIAEVLDEILPEAFATVREAARRLVGTNVMVTGHELEWNMVHYDVQLMGGIELHLGKIAEMATGEGKTLVATLPLYLNALPGRGAHLVTVNSYLARRDSQWMGHLYSYLGLTVGCIDDTEPGTQARRAAYECDITYGTNNEFGFDYLRDNMVVALDQRVQRSHIYAIVDEVDSVLIDEARTPLIISGPVGNDTDAEYAMHNPAVTRLVRRQTDLANQLVGEGERALEAGDTDRAALLLYKARLGAPKNKRFMKAMQEQGVKQLVNKMELDHIADRKLPASKQQYRDIEDDLLYVLDERGHTVHLTDRGVDEMSPGDHDSFVLPDISSEIHRIEHDPDMDPQAKIDARQAIEREYAMKSERLHIVHQLLRAHALYEKDVNYVIQEGQVLIVDEFTGRTMPGRRWSEGLHQAVEAKEGVQVKGETQTLATITIQNYFRMYEKLSGMTGTAETEEAEFHQIYGLEVAVIPTNKPMIRDDRHDLVYKTRREKYNALLEETERLHKLGYPVLVGTVSVDVSETLSRMFKRAGIPHNVLNAKYHQREAEIVAGAGQPGAVTIATNMAGRGTDIKLGPGVTESHPSQVKDPDGNVVDVMEIGGLHIIGSERHESRRIDRQLRGRSGRQGDPGASQFFLSLEDDLMRLFNSDRIARLMDRLGAQEGEVLTHPLITRSIGQAQKRVEIQNFQSRKRLLDFDDVMNQQREVIYSLRSFALEGGEELKGEALKMVDKALNRRVDDRLANLESESDWDLSLLKQELLMHYLLTVPEFEGDHPPTSLEPAREVVVEAGRRQFAGKVEELDRVKDEDGTGFSGRLLALVMLNVLDEKWKDHLYDLDQLRAAIHYRSWGQKDPLIEYKQEAYSMFVDLMNDIYNTFAERFFRAQLVFQQPELAAPSGNGDGARGRGGEAPRKPTKRYNALGILEDIPEEEPSETGNGAAEPVAASPPAPPAAEEKVLDVGPAEPPKKKVAARQDPVVVGAGRARSLNPAANAPTAPADWSNVGRNDPCPCGSGKKFKKCHGANA
ncbi:MAG TPA: preprotein translocase subunit SecA [Gemmatimonadaceae bacterium]|jgi:preprotein translocase subunit SecA|nr:preprotein translocase subunit SecA [Gemmatimonadaceae bacterium]